MNRRKLLSGLPLLLAMPHRPAAAAEAGLLAANVLLEPEARFAAYLRGLNERLRAVEPRGFAFDATHVPHLSLLQLYLRAADLGEMKATLVDILGRVPPPADLRTTGIETNPRGDLHTVTLQVERSRQLERLQAAVVTGLKPYVAATRGEPAAFVREPPDREIDASTLDHVGRFIEQHTGGKFRPHFTVGLGTEAAASALREAPFEPRSFKVERVGIYQLGNAGTARRPLWHVNA